MTTSASSWHNLPYPGPAAGGGAVAAPTITAAARGPFRDNDEDKHSFLVSPPQPPALSRSSFGYGSNSSSSSSNSSNGAGSLLLLPAFVPFVGTTRHKNKHRSCGCPVVADGITATSHCRCLTHPSYASYAASCPSLVAIGAAGAAEAERRPSATDNSSLAASFDDLEQRIKRVRLSSTPGELCWARELRDLCSRHQGWRPPPNAHAASTHAPHRNVTAAASAASISGEPSWYDKVLEEIVVGTAAHGQDRAMCRMVLEPLAPHRLALHLQYRRVLHEAWEDDIGDYRRSNVLPEIRVDVRIPRHYPHEPPVVSSVRYHHHHAHRNEPTSAYDSGDDNDEAMEIHYPRRATSDSWPRSLLRRHSLCQVDSIVLVPFDPEGASSDPELLVPCDNDGADENQQQDDEPGKRGDLNDQPMVTTSSADAADQGHTIGHGPFTTLWNPDCRREMKVHGYSPVHRLSDVLERIAVALWCATTRNTTLVVVPTHGGASDINDDMDMSMGANARNGSGLNHRHPGCSSSSSSGVALHGSVMSSFPTHSASSASNASWLSSGVTVTAAGAWATSVGKEEADQATERHL